MLNTTQTLMASEPATHEALLEMGFTGNAADWYSIGDEMGGDHFVLTIAPIAGRYDYLYLTARIMSDDESIPDATASDMAGVRAFYEKLQAITTRLEAAAEARSASMLPEGWVAPFSGESIHERAITAALESTGLAALFTECPEGTTPW
jgi:hypothetical protein